MLDGPALRDRMSKAREAQARGRARVSALAVRLQTAPRWRRPLFRLALLFARARIRAHEARERKAKLRLMSMALG